MDVYIVSILSTFYLTLCTYCPLYRFFVDFKTKIHMISLCPKLSYFTIHTWCEAEQSGWISNSPSDSMPISQRRSGRLSVMMLALCDSSERYLSSIQDGADEWSDFFGWSGDFSDLLISRPTMILSSSRMRRSSVYGKQSQIQKHSTMLTRSLVISSIRGISILQKYHLLFAHFSSYSQYCLSGYIWENWAK